MTASEALTAFGVTAQRAAEANRELALATELLVRALRDDGTRHDLIDPDDC